MPHKGENHTPTQLRMRHQVCPSDTCHTTISESTIPWSYPGAEAIV